MDLKNKRLSGLLFGIGVGIALAVALDNIAIGVGVGVIFGISIAAGLTKKEE